MTVFNLITGIIARWLQRQLAKGEATPTVIAAFSGLLFVFTVANLAIGVALAPRYAEGAPDAIYGNNLAQQITSTFDVVVCALSLAVLLAMMFTGPLSGYLVRRREKRTVTAPPAPAPPAPTPEPATTAAPAAATPTAGWARPPAAMPRIVRLKEDSTTALPVPATQEFAAPTAALRIQRRQPTSDATTQIPTAQNPAVQPAAPDTDPPSTPAG
jgi:hypothetical protein